MTDVHSAGEFYSAFPERRINQFRPELRSVDGGNGPKHIWGYASMFNKLSRKLGGFVERVDSRAFTEGRAIGFPDVVCRFNHNDDFLLGTVNARTCLIDVDSTGLLYDVVPPSFRKDIIELMERGDVSSSSFAFRVPEGGDDWGLSDFNYPLRTLLSVDLVDVAPVTTPAYPDATSAVRSMDGAVQSLATRFDVEPAEIRSLLEANQGVKLFKRTDRPSAPAVQLTGFSTGANTYSTAGTSATLEITTIIPEEAKVSLEEKRLALYEDEVRAKYDAAALKKAASSGATMPNANGEPSYPIQDEEDLHDAIHAVGRGHASHEAIRQHIITRAKALGLSHMLPADWTSEDNTPAAADSSDEKNSAEETSEERVLCANCGKPVEERTETPTEEVETVEEPEKTEEIRTEETESPAEVTEEVTNGHVIDNGEAQLAKLGLQRRQRIAELQEKRFDPFIGTDE
jgi:HK97 family phage prohead protease